MDDGREDLLVGKVLAGRYRLEESIGRGGMSVVYRAHDRTLGRAVAIKLVALPAHSAAMHERLRERFRREAGAAAGIPPHPNLVHIYDYGSDPELDLDFIAMELLRGRDLKQALATSGLEMEQALRVLLEAARGVAAGHRAGILHRDVKPANLFLLGERQIEGVRVLDFGIAKALGVEDDLTMEGELPPHSPSYASPEQRDPAASVTPASDVYQLGLVGYEMLTGERPFTEEERARLHRGEAAPLRPRPVWQQVPEGIRAVIERCLLPAPSARYATAAEFAEALARAMEASTPVAPAPGSAPPVGDDATVMDGAPHGQAVVPPWIEGVEVRPASWPARRAAQRLPGGATAVALAAVLVAGLVWAASRLTGGGDDGRALLAALDMEALDEQFGALQHAAARDLLGAEPGGDAQAAEQVQRVIADVYAAWADGDLERFASHYADRVQVDGRRVRRSTLVRERRQQRERLDDVEVTLERQAIEFPEPARARALVDRSWRLRGPELEWDGAARQEFHLAWQDGRWRITGEEELEVYRSECTGC
jgi:predicted Ser/Thr protein kinase